MDEDRPLEQQSQDRLGFGPVAEHLAEAILGQAGGGGLVFGIEGCWGSGKSSIINLTKHILKDRNPAPEIISFSPWLVGDRGTLLQDLFNELAAAVVRAEAAAGVSSSTSKSEKRTQLAAKLKRYGDFASGAGKAAKVLSLAGVPLAGIAAELLTSSGDAASSVLDEQPLSQRKAELVESLAAFDRTIVVFVDDLDRLEPREASEVLRLIRAVADFPRVVYVLSYDPVVVAHTLTSAAQIEDGAGFLEKIVQASFRVPRPEAFDLRRWFEGEVRRIFSASLGDRASQHQPDLRLASVISSLGGRYLETPRDVVRTLNSLKLHATPVLNEIDLADAVWLHLLRIGNPDLYHWVEEYLTNFAHVATGQSFVTDATAKRSHERLMALLEKEEGDTETALFDLAKILPGIDRGFSIGRNAESRKVYLSPPKSLIDDLVASRRLGSPDHYRYYFALSNPAGSLRDQEVRSFISTSSSSPEAASLALRSFAGRTRAQGGTMADVLIDRLNSWPQIDSNSWSPIILALGDQLDQFAKEAGYGDWGRSLEWENGQLLLSRALKALKPKARRSLIKELFGSGRSLGWLSNVLRSEIFAHGHYGDRAVDPEQRLLTPQEFQIALNLLPKRLAKADDLLETPRLLSVLYGWEQAVGPEPVLRWVANQIDSDEGLLALLDAMRSWQATNGTVHFPLSRTNVVHFVGEAGLQHLTRIASDRKSPDAVRQKASQLVALLDE